MTKLDRTRQPLRLPTTLLDDIDNVARLRGETRTHVIEDALKDLIKALQHDQCSHDELSYLTERSKTRTTSTLIQTRLPRWYVEYLKINKYNIAACVKYAWLRYNKDV